MVTDCSPQSPSAFRVVPTQPRAASIAAACTSTRPKHKLHATAHTFQSATELPLWQGVSVARRCDRIQFGGVGLGLALVHEIVRVHDGSITIKSNPAGGTIFEVIF